jgi:hypothetical protein
MWVPGTQLTDVHKLKLPANLPPDVFQLRVGLYHWPDLERMSVIDSGCFDAANSALLVGHILLNDAQKPGKSTCPTMHWINIDGG